MYNVGYFNTELKNCEDQMGVTKFMFENNTFDCFYISSIIWNLFYRYLQEFYYF